MGFDPVAGGSGADRERARRMAAATDHEGVTEDLLAGGGRFSGTFYLHEAPAIAYLDSDERPRFAFFNHVRGVGVDDDPHRHEPDTHGIAIVLVTGRRVLALVGCEDGDRAVSLHYDVVTGVGYEAGDLHHRLVVETAEATYDLWISRQFDAAGLRAAAEFVSERLVDPDRLLDDDPPDGEDGSTWVAVDGGTLGDAAGPDAGSAVGDGHEQGMTDAEDRGQGMTDGLDREQGVTDAENHEQGVAAGLDGTRDLAGSDPAGDGDGGTTGPLDGSDGAVAPEAGDGPGEDPLARIQRLHSLLEAGAISRSEYEAKKTDLLDRV